jgi:hypothetical protein
MVVRETAQVVVGAFASKISSLLHGTDSFLVTEGNASNVPFSFDTLMDIVENGEHLEHFHSYKKSSNSIDEPSTIEMHTDQGLMLLFTPGRLTTGELTSGFFIQSAQGATEEVYFEGVDDLILMLGDGVNQYINPKIQDSNIVLRAVPHAVKLEASEHARTWYGLMVLPPAEAIHPAYGDITYGELRQNLVAGDIDAIHLACSNSYSEYWITGSRMLDEINTTCANSTLFYCWHQCYVLADFNVTEESCASQSRELKCIDSSRNNTLWSGVTHGSQYIPGCAGSDWEVEEVPITPAPVVAAPMASPPVKAPVSSPTMSSDSNTFAHIQDLTTLAALVCVLTYFQWVP